MDAFSCLIYQPPHRLQWITKTQFMAEGDACSAEVLTKASEIN